MQGDLTAQISEVLQLFICPTPALLSSPPISVSFAT